MSLRSIAIHLPQFHPVPENDTWWGKGFTEWTNVTKAKKLFRNHYQPHLPADLGFYDLRLEESRIAQESLAKEFGIYGFCYYHYWFNGKKLLYEPIERKLANQKESLPFMLCWANENWTRVWDGGENKLLLRQEYRYDDDINHFNYLMRFFKDSRYIRVDNRPVFCIYRASMIPDLVDRVKFWRELAFRDGINLYLCMFESFGQKKIDPVYYGFDAAIQFPPFGILENNVGANCININSEIQRFVNRLRSLIQPYLNKINFISYDELINTDLKVFNQSYKLFPSVTPGWDNTPRRKRPTIVMGSTPEKFGFWIDQKLKLFKPYSHEENFFFINAWNEWAEGNHLEPCQKWGKAYLEALKNSFDNAKKS